MQELRLRITVMKKRKSLIREDLFIHSILRELLHLYRLHTGKMIANTDVLAVMEMQILHPYHAPQKMELQGNRLLLIESWQ